ncbi:putative protein phosphatase 2C 77 [Dichanthelium oligosanthes]|uniref:protein-serine/threonine phosphatase n=1 Tax=Dichanthelium oligosanthes TaxID=888268 RepID=A0A1E5V4C7_9POAL|nr:putative protein phosphatase 2C 77 [Dichanthelium oligosanthes]
MLHGVRFLRSAAAAFARLAHAIFSTGWALFFMPLCSPTSASTPVPAPWQQLQPARAKVHPAALAVDEKPAGCSKDQLLQVSSPAAPVLVLPAIKQQAAEKTARAARGRPPRLAIPPPVACAPGVDPFGAAADRETDVATELEAQGEGFCLASRRGVRHAMEDGYGVITDHNIEGGSQLAFYGVYDGHGGRAAVDFVADKLGKNVVAALAAAQASSRRQQQSKLWSSPPPLEMSEEEEEEDGETVVAAIRAAYLTTDSEFLSQGVRGGACAATALVKDGDLYVANVGDCRAVLGSRGGVATPLTSDHTAGREDERRRIESSGGYVSCGSSGVWRVQDCLAVSRAFGDASMKPWVTCEPEVSRRRLTPDCRFLVVASDGLWNKVSCQEAVDAVSAAAAGASSSSVGSCKELVALARNRGSRDDITVMVVDLQRFTQ